MADVPSEVRAEEVFGGGVLPVETPNGAEADFADDVGDGDFNEPYCHGFTFVSAAPWTSTVEIGVRE